MRPLVNRVEQDPKDPKRKFCQSMVIWGKVTRDAKLEYTKGSETAPPKPKVTFGVAYGDKGAENDKKFMNCISIGECYQTDLAQRVRAGDYVLIAGRWSSKEYTNKDGEQRTWNELRIEHIEILSDGFREAVVDAMTTAMSKILTLGRYDEKRDFENEPCAYDDNYADCKFDCTDNPVFVHKVDCAHENEKHAQSCDECLNGCSLQNAEQHADNHECNARRHSVAAEFDRNV